MTVFADKIYIVFSLPLIEYTTLPAADSDLTFTRLNRKVQYTNVSHYVVEGKYSDNRLDNNEPH